MKVDDLKVGDLIWQARSPGGICLVLDIKHIMSSDCHAGWLDVDFPVLQVLHPSEGLIEDPSYYYMTLEDEEKYSRRRVAYELKKVGRAVPDWLQKEIAEDESG